MLPIEASPRPVGEGINFVERFRLRVFCIPAEARQNFHKLHSFFFFLHLFFRPDSLMLLTSLSFFVTAQVAEVHGGRDMG